MSTSEQMQRLESAEQLQIGTRLHIVARSEKDCYGSVSVKRICVVDGESGKEHEVIINRSRNYYFNLEKLLRGKSCWVKEVYVLQGKDRRLKEAGIKGEKA